MPIDRLALLAACALALGCLACAPREEPDEPAGTVEEAAADGTATDAAVMATEPMGTEELGTEMDPRATDSPGSIGASVPPEWPAAAVAPSVTSPASEPDSREGAGRTLRDEGAALDGERLTYYQQASAELCEADCATNDSCAGWTFIRKGAYVPSDPTMCYLMRRVDAWQPNPCCISGVKDPAAIAARVDTAAPTSTPPADAEAPETNTNACAGYDPETDDEAFVFTDVGTTLCSACATSCSSCQHFRVCGCAVRDYEKYRGANACVECMDTCLQTNG